MTKKIGLRNGALACVFALALTLLVSPTPINAIEGGYSSPSLIGATVALVDSETGTYAYCSGMLLDENVIATAAHCVIDASGNVRSNIWISPAGADLSTSPKLTAATQIFNIAGWKNVSSSVSGDDIAFVTTKTSLGKPIFSKILSTAEVKGLYGQSVILSGYGRKGVLSQTSQKPLFLQQRVIDWVLDYLPYGTYTHVVATDTETPCPGDSGGPIFKEDAGKYYAVGVIAAGNGCTTINRKEEREVGFIISAFSTLYQQALAANKVLPYSPVSTEIVENSGQVRVSWPEVANRLLATTAAYEIQDGNKKVICRAEQISLFRNARECSFNLDTSSVGPISLVPIGIKTNGSPIDLKLDYAINKLKSAASDKAAADAKAITDKAAAAQKKIADKAAADAKAIADKAAADAKAIADKAAADAKAIADKAAADAKAIADKAAAAQKKIADKAAADAKAIADKAAAAQKKITITCAKGKLVKKVTSTNPKCPAGYKKK